MRFVLKAKPRGGYFVFDSRRRERERELGKEQNRAHIIRRRSDQRMAISHWKSPPVAHNLCCYRALHTTTTRTTSSTLSLSQRPLRYAVVGAGFAGLSVAWHLLNSSGKDLGLHIDIYDEVGIGGGASGVSGGLLHPYSPKGKLLWRGAECWNECLKLLSIAEAAAPQNFNGSIVRRRIETIDQVAAQNLASNLCLPFNSAFYMPEAVNIHPQHYLQALFLACENLVKELPYSGLGVKELHLHKKSIHKLLDFEGEYDAVVVCLGAKADLLPELSGRLPLRTCRGVIAHLQLPDDMGEDYPEHGPSILSDAWLAFQGPRSLYMGSTWEWKSSNSSPNVSADESYSALQELLPKANVIYPAIKNWTFTGAKAGLRAMPPLTPHGSLPLLGCINDVIGGNYACNYWLFGGLGSRGLLYHGWLGKLIAQAMLCSNEEIIPTELTSWKKMKQ
ncbi:uncharacterized protein LOC142643147 isoform X3 [Castanea sativa]|uniref:uncharacterized protein LOC142643147 isoform X3 n=1 Tax=Castanea sativa TaxID=21020 RepID=UPI003F652459